MTIPSLESNGMNEGDDEKEGDDDPDHPGEREHSLKKPTLAEGNAATEAGEDALKKVHMSDKKNTRQFEIVAHRGIRSSDQKHEPNDT